MYRFVFVQESCVYRLCFSFYHLRYVTGRPMRYGGIVLLHWSAVYIILIIIILERVREGGEIEHCNDIII